MDEARIKALYRSASRREPALDDAMADDIQAVLTGYGWPADDVAPIDRVAGSTTAAAIARVVAELAPDARQMAHALSEARTPRQARRPQTLRRGFAMAAGVGAVALLFAMTIQPHRIQTSPVQGHESVDVISAISFENGSDAGSISAPQTATDATIFRGNFDS